MIIAPLLAVAASVSTPNQIFMPEPTVSLNAIRMISCDEGSGTGFIIGDNILATALHVASLSHCTDAATKVKLITYVKDDASDFALMTGNLPDVLPIRYSCVGYKDGMAYSSYGLSPWRSTYPVFGQYQLIASSDYTDDSFIVRGEDSNKAMPGMRHLVGYIIPGNSGGPVIDNSGYAVGINNVSARGLFGMSIVKDGYSYELKNTPLCR